ncbi:hypothetical protein LOZ20_001455 [Ophidiomyces ophidiicola]|nr:hypothetical protein LOZ20_001455 [Ophidiomyces ophidiicola]
MLYSNELSLSGSAPAPNPPKISLLELPFLTQQKIVDHIVRVDPELEISGSMIARRQAELAWSNISALFAVSSVLSPKLVFRSSWLTIRVYFPGAFRDLAFDRLYYKNNIAVLLFIAPLSIAMAALSLFLRAHERQLRLKVKSSLVYMASFRITANRLLGIAVLRGFDWAVLLLLQSGASPAARMDGTSVLFTAVSLERHGIIDILLEYGAEPDEKDEHSSLGLAASKFDFATMDKLLKHRASTNIYQEIGGITYHIIEWAAHISDYRMLRLLLKYGALHSFVTYQVGMDPLIVSIINDSLQIVALLLGYGYWIEDLDKRLHALGFLPSLDMRNLLASSGILSQNFVLV